MHRPKELRVSENVTIKLTRYVVDVDVARFIIRKRLALVVDILLQRSDIMNGVRRLSAVRLLEPVACAI